MAKRGAALLPLLLAGCLLSLALRCTSRAFVPALHIPRLRPAAAALAGAAALAPAAARAELLSMQALPPTDTFMGISFPVALAALVFAVTWAAYLVTFSKPAKGAGSAASRQPADAARPPSLGDGQLLDYVEAREDFAPLVQVSAVLDVPWKVAASALAAAPNLAATPTSVAAPAPVASTSVARSSRSPSPIRESQKPAERLEEKAEPRSRSPSPVRESQELAARLEEKAKALAAKATGLQGDLPRRRSSALSDFKASIATHKPRPAEASIATDKPRPAEASIATDKPRPAEATQRPRRSRALSDFKASITTDKPRPAEALSVPISFHKEPARFKVGQKVMLNGVHEGIVRYVGPTTFADGDWVGVELFSGDGEHDGTYLDHKYFSCPAGRGVLRHPCQITEAAAIHRIEDLLARIEARKLAREAAMA